MLGIYGTLYREHRTRKLSETLTIDFNSVTEIELSNLTGNYRSTNDKEVIHLILDYLSQAQYKRLINDQITYMPKRASIIYIYNNDQSNFIIPYRK